MPVPTIPHTNETCRILCLKGKRELQAFRAGKCTAPFLETLDFQSVQNFNHSSEQLLQPGSAPPQRGELQEILSMEILKCGNIHTHSQVSKSTCLTPQISFKTSPKGTRPQMGLGALRFGAHPLLTSPALLDSARAHMEQNIPGKQAFPTEWSMAVIQAPALAGDNPGLRARTAPGCPPFLQHPHPTSLLRAFLCHCSPSRIHRCSHSPGRAGPDSGAAQVQKQHPGLLQQLPGHRDHPTIPTTAQAQKTLSPPGAPGEPPLLGHLMSPTVTEGPQSTHNTNTASHHKALQATTGQALSALGQHRPRQQQNTPRTQHL